MTRMMMSWPSVLLSRIRLTTSPALRVTVYCTLLLGVSVPVAVSPNTSEPPSTDVPSKKRMAACNTASSSPSTAVSSTGTTISGTTPMPSM